MLFCACLTDKNNILFINQSFFMEINLDVTLIANETGLGMAVEGNDKVLKVITLLEMSLDELTKTLSLYIQKMPEGLSEKEVREHLRELDFKTLEASKTSKTT